MQCSLESLSWVGQERLHILVVGKDWQGNG